MTHRSGRDAKPDNRTAPVPLVRLDGVTVAFSGRPVFANLSFSLYAGGHLALLGPNGSGKSTLMRLLEGRLRPAQGPAGSAGAVVWGFGGKEETSPLAALARVRLVSPLLQRNYVRQGWKISGEEILLSGLTNAPMVYGEMSAACYEKAAALAASADASQLLAMHAPAMSQGQLRLALILRALMSAPDLLLLDEPFDGLDAPARERVSRCIALAMQRATVLVSAHRREDIPGNINEALLFEKGGLRRVPLGRPERTRPQSALAGDGPDRPDAEPCPGRAESAGPARPDAPALLELRHVDVFIDRRKVLADISWTVRQGEQWIVSGRNGSGKSTLLRLLYGEEFAAFGGTLLWRGRPRPGLEELHRVVGYVSDRLQDLYDYDLCVEDLVLSGLRGEIGLYREFSAKERELARERLEQAGLADVGAAPFHSLSSGIMRRVLLARALVSSPPVLLLDEPLSGLDRESRDRFLDNLPRLAARGVTIIYVSHHEQDKSALFTHELRLENGRVALAGPRQ